MVCEERHLPLEERSITPLMNYSNFLHTPVIIMGSTLIVASTISSYRFRKIDHFLQMYLAISDLLVGVVEIPFQFYVSEAKEDPLTNKYLCILNYTITDLLYSSSLVLLSILTICKCIAINKPFWWNDFIQEATFFKSLIMACMALTLNSTTVITFNSFVYDADAPSNKTCHEENIPSIYRNYLKFAISGALLVLSGMICVQLLWVVHRQKEKLKARNQRVGKNTFTVISLNLLFIVLWLPTVSLVSKDSPYYCYRAFIARQFRSLNSSVNAFLYAAINEQQRVAYRFLLKTRPWEWNLLEGHMRRRSGTIFVDRHSQRRLTWLQALAAKSMGNQNADDDTLSTYSFSSGIMPSPKTKYSPDIDENRPRSDYSNENITPDPARKRVSIYVKRKSFKVVKIDSATNSIAKSPPRSKTDLSPVKSFEKLGTLSPMPEKVQKRSKKSSTLYQISGIQASR